MPQLEILYRDDDYIAVNKPQGLLVHRSRLAADAPEFALQIVRKQLGHKVYPVHRLDRATGGILIFGLNPLAARELCRCFEQGEVQKNYIALVRGYTEPEGTIDYPLREDKAKDLQNAITQYRRLAMLEIPRPVRPYPTARYSLLEIRPITGRMHQIRKHLAHIFHPILGDTTYGDGHHNRMIREHFDFQAMLLMSQKLIFPHPFRHNEIVIEAALPREWREFFERLERLAMGASPTWPWIEA
jgi:tRNA pseudouridine65 synthase